MNELEVIDIGRDAIWVLIKLSLPLMLTALIVGLTISLFQALTQIQEMTLSFVPKIIAMFASLLFLLPYMIHTLTEFTEELMDKVVAIQ